MGESSSDECWRLVPFSQVKSPKAKGWAAAGSAGAAGGVGVGAKGAGGAVAGGADGAGAAAGGGSAGGGAEGAGGGAAAGAVSVGGGVACAYATPSTSMKPATPTIHAQRVRADIERFIVELRRSGRSPAPDLRCIRKYFST